MVTFQSYFTAHRLSSTPAAFSDECNKLHSIFLKLDYPINLINSSTNNFLHNIDNIEAPKNAIIKDQQSANSFKREMQNLGQHWCLY